MAIDTIDLLTAWLQKPLYEAGVLLYEQYVGTGFVLTMLKGGPDDYNRKTLADALSEKLSELQAGHKAKVEAYPEQLAEAIKESGLQMDTRTVLKERMRQLHTAGVSESEDLKSLAFQVLSITDDLDRIYGRRDFFEQNGFLPEAASVLPEEARPTDLLKRRNSVRTYVTKYKQAVSATFDPDDLARAQAKLKRYQTELADLDAMLNDT